MAGLLDLLGLNGVQGTDPTSQGLLGLPSAQPLQSQPVSGPVAQAVPPVAQQAPVSAPADFAPPTDGDTQQPQGGLLGLIGQASQEAVQSPEASQGLLSALGQKAQEIGSKLTNLSPAASQGLLATGLGILANNNGTMNLGQVVGYGGMSGLNAYNAQKQQEAQQAYQQQSAQQLAARTAIEQQNLRLQALQAGKPFEVNGQTFALNPQGTGYAQVNPGGPGKVARTQEITNSDGSKSVIQLDQNGQQVGQPIQAAPSAANAPVMLTGDELAKRNEATTQAVTAGTQKIGQIDTLLAGADNPALRSGIKSQASRLYNNVTGQTDPNAQYRQQFDAFRTQFINQSLPPGSASDADIKNAQATVPASDASPEAIKAWLTTARAAQQKVNAYAQANNEFTQLSKGGTKTLQDVPLPDGTTGKATYDQFMQARGLTAPAQAPQGQSQSQQQAPAIRAQAVAGLSPDQQTLVQQAVASGNPAVIAKLRAKGYIH